MPELKCFKVSFNKREVLAVREALNKIKETDYPYSLIAKGEGCITMNLTLENVKIIRRALGQMKETDYYNQFIAWIGSEVYDFMLALSDIWDEE